MSSKTEVTGARLPKRERGRQRVAELLGAATQVFAEKGYEAATMTEIAARAGAPIGSLYQFFPSKEALADTLLQRYVAMLSADLTALEARASGIDLGALVESLFALLRGHPEERAAAIQLAEARTDEKTRHATFRPMLRRHIAAILRAREPSLPADTARDMAIVVQLLMKAASTLDAEEGLVGAAAARRELHMLACAFLQQRLAPRA